MARFSELLQELALSEGDIAEGQERLARQAEFVGGLDASIAVPLVFTGVLVVLVIIGAVLLIGR
jgi:hypothetical protein